MKPKKRKNVYEVEFENFDAEKILTALCKAIADQKGIECDIEVKKITEEPA